MEGKQMKSFLLIGQSNMAGRGFPEEVKPIYNEKIQMLRNGRWQMMVEPIHFDRAVAGVGPAASFAAMWLSANPGETVGLIPCAEGGSSLNDWAAGGILFRHAVAEARFAMETSELAGILWHQGEGDAYQGLYQAYYKKLDAIFKALRTELHAPEVPILIGGLGDYLGKRAFGANCTEYEQVNEELKRYAMEQANCYFVTADGLTANPDGIHINAVSQRKFGIRYWKAYSERTHVLVPPENEDALAECCAEKPYTQGERMYQVLEQFSRGKMSFEEFNAKAAEIYR